MLCVFVGSEGWNYGFVSHVVVWEVFWSVCLASCFDLFVLSCMLYVSVHVVCGMLYAVRFCWLWRLNLWPFCSCPRLSGVLVSSFCIMFWLVCFVLYVVCIISCSVWYIVCCAFLLALKRGITAFSLMSSFEWGFCQFVLHHVLTCLQCLVCWMYQLMWYMVCCMLYVFVGSEGRNNVFSHVLVWAGFWSICFASCFDLFVLSCVLYVSVQKLRGMLYAVRFCWFWWGKLWPFSYVLVWVGFWSVRLASCFDLFDLSCMLYVSVHVVCGMLYAVRFCWFWGGKVWFLFIMSSVEWDFGHFV